MKRAIVTVVAAGLLVLGSAGVAAAQQTGGSTNPSTPPSSGAGQHHRHRGIALGVLRVSASTLGVQPRELVTSLCGGKTLAQVAGAKTQDLVNALVKAADQRIDQVATNRHLDASTVAQRKAKVQQRVTNLVNSFHPSAQRCQRLQHGGTTPNTST
jgi:hypothetical protein